MQRAPRQRQPGDRLFEYTVSRKRGQRGFRALHVLVGLWFLLCLSAPVAALVIVAHFILKYW